MTVAQRNQADSGSIPDIEISNWSENEVDLIKDQSQVGDIRYETPAS